MDLGPHATFIWAAYGAVTLVLAGLIGWLVVDGRRQQQRLDEFEMRGIRRRSATPGSRKSSQGA